MTELKIKIPDELNELTSASNIKWQDVVRRLLKQEIGRLAELKRIVSKSKLTEKDVAELSKKIDESLSHRFSESLKG